VSFVKMAVRDTLRASCARARLGIAASVLVIFLTTFGFADSVFGEIITYLQPISGVSGVSSDPASYSIAEINAAGGIVVGNILFDTFRVTPSSSAGASAPTAASIEITGVEVDGEYGFKVNSLWMASAGEWVDTAMTYHASLLEGAVAEGHVIDGNALYITAVGGANTTSGIASISETLYANYPTMREPSLVKEFTYYTGSSDESLWDTGEFGPVTSLWVVKDIGVSGGTDRKGAMAMSEFYQTFSEAPEPSALVLLGIGVLGIAGFAWRHRRSG
jgi:hypothetical protein